MIAFIENHYFIFTYNIGLILAMSFIVYKVMKKRYNDSQIAGIVFAAGIWPIMIVVNILAAFFGNLRNMLNMLIPVTKVDKRQSPLLKKVEENPSETVNLDGVTTTGRH